LPEFTSAKKGPETPKSYAQWAKLLQKAVCRSVFLTIWHCNWSVFLTIWHCNFECRIKKTHYFAYWGVIVKYWVRGLHSNRADLHWK